MIDLSQIEIGYFWQIGKAVLLVFIGWLLARILSRTLAKVFQHNMTSHSLMLVRQGSFYLIFILFTVSALRELGFNLSVLLGAAGIVTVALGFAAQTSAANLISGLFLLGERPFSLGDVIKVGNCTGEIISIDLLSVKLRTLDNIYVRIPNETIIKSEVQTLTKLPIRRLDMVIGVSYDTDLKKAQETLMQVADLNPVCLEDPKPLFIITEFADSSINIQFSIWSQRTKFTDLKNSMFMGIKKAFDEAGIEIPFPQRVIHQKENP